jgi:hypothetical protein
MFIYFFFGIIPIYSCWYFIYSVCDVFAGEPESWQGFPVKHTACQLFSVCVGNNEYGVFFNALNFDF